MFTYSDHSNLLSTIRIVDLASLAVVRIWVRGRARHFPLGSIRRHIVLFAPMRRVVRIRKVPIVMWEFLSHDDFLVPG
jgi:hypothetical protein